MQKTPEDRNCLACAFPFWAQLTADEQEMLCRYTRPVHYRKGARVHSPLESCVGILLLRTGQLRAYLLSEDGPGLYAAGDCTGGLLQVAKAVYEGAQAGTEAAKALRKG